MENLELPRLKEILEALNEAIKCPVCLEVLQRDTILCINGHAVCRKCIGNDGNCPSCRQNISNVKQNSILKQILEVIPHRCRYKNCSDLVDAGDDHEIYCPSRPTTCKFCKEEVAVEDLPEHFKSKHTADDNFLPAVCAKIFPEDNPALILTNFNPDNTHQSVSIVSAFDHFLWQVWENKPETNMFTVTYIPEFKGKPSHDIYVKRSFKSPTMEYNVNLKINPIPTEENSFSIPISIVKQFLNKEKKEIRYSRFITKSME